MARWLRLVAPNFPMHVTQRGRNRATVFHDAQDFAQYRAILRDASARARCEIHAYALMTNHVHILLTPANTIGPARLLQSVGSRFVRYWNKRHQRSGTLWDGRFRSSVIDNDRYLLACCRYIDLNPVRAGIVAGPESYEWSSYGRLAHGMNDMLVTPHPSYLALGSTDQTRELVYRDACLLGTPQSAICTIRDALRGGGVAGSEQFHERLERLLKRRTARLTHGGDRKGENWRADRPRFTQTPVQLPG
jgi:putative transposase